MEYEEVNFIRLLLDIMGKIRSKKRAEQHRAAMEEIRAKIKKMDNSHNVSLNKYELEKAIRQEKRRRIREKYDNTYGWKEQILDDFEPNFEQFTYTCQSIYPSLKI